MIEVLNDQGFSLINSNFTSYKYAGRPSHVEGSAWYPADQDGVWKRWDLQHYASSGPYTTGHRRLYCKSEVNKCHTEVYDVALLDEYGFCEMRMLASSFPLFFIHLQDASVSCNILSVVDEGIIEDAHQYKLTIIFSFPPALRFAAFEKIDIYCFEKTTGISPGYGMATFRENGELAFYSEDQPLLIKDTFEIDEVSGTIDSYSITAHYLSGDGSMPSNIGDLSKPAFLMKDWCRPVYTQTDRYTVEGYDSYWGECEDYYSYYAKYVKMFHPGGFHFSGGITTVNIVGGEILDFSCGNASDEAGTVWNAALPSFVPIIDGALYD
jgi:hypothetical protein